MTNRQNIVQSVDWITIGIFFLMILLGWLNIYAADYNPEEVTSIFDPSSKAGKQFIWIIGAVVIMMLLYYVDYKLLDTLAYALFGFTVFLLLAVLIVGTEKNGARSWFDLGFISLQPSEFAKIATCMALCRFLSDKNPKNQSNKFLIYGAGFLLVPITLILMQPDTGSVLVFFSLIVVLYINGISNGLFFSALALLGVFILSLVFNEVKLIVSFSVLAGIAIYFFRKRKKIVIAIFILTGAIILQILGTQFFVHKVLQPHQRKRIEVILDPSSDPKGAGWNTIQSKIAIGSGGFTGKGFLDGNITKGDFVPEQFTDFIFCTVGEEHGFIGSFFIVALFVILLLRLIKLAERQKSHFAHLYGYSVVAIFLFHFLINIGMALGILPVIGIPLPFFSYGGSSLWSFTILLFIFIKLDAHRGDVLARR
ncbi:MAG: rod shape-determining protein RodA [Cyclobacteriaceae bacterium]